MQNGHLAVFSPVALTEDVKSHIKKMGHVKYIIAPDIEHHLFLDTWHRAYPEAKLIGPIELVQKRNQENAPLPWSYVWKDDVPPSVDAEFDHEFEYTFVSAHPNKELVFNHKRSKTLIQADLLFNLPATEQYSKSGIDPTTGYMTQAFTFFNDAEKGPALWQQGFMWYVVSARNRPSFNKSIRIIDGWDFTRMIPSHGDVVEGNAKQVFEKVFAWHLVEGGRRNGKPPKTKKPGRKPKKGGKKTPGDPKVPDEPGKPGKGDKPGDPKVPEQPGKGGKPKEPKEPGHGDQPKEPKEPWNGGIPKEPKEPGNGDRPGESKEPWKGDKPGESNGPKQQNRPETPKDEP